MKKQIIFILSCIVILSIATGCGSKSKTENPADNKASTTKIKSDPPKKKYVQLAEKTNASMPMLIPGNVRMDRAEAVSAKEYKYYYTFTQEPVVSAEEFIRSSKPALSIGMREQKGEDLDMFRKDKMTVIYAYYKLDGTLFAEIKITPNEYTE
jgi:hypothetical protein